MERQLLISATLVAALAGGTGAWADCAAEIAQLTQGASAAPPPDPGASGEGEDEDGGAFATWGQEEQPQSQSGEAEAGQAGGTGEAGDGDHAAALQRAQAALDAGDEAACMEAVEEAKAM
jgi:hypothetical protein